MKKVAVLLMCVVTIVFAKDVYKQLPITSSWIADTVIEDYKNFYSFENLMYLSAGFGVGAVLANTDIDQNFQDWYIEEKRNDTTDRYVRFLKFLVRRIILSL